MAFKVIDEEARTVQVGTGNASAIDPRIAGAITIPTTANGYNVVSIGQDAFSGCSQITSVVVPEGVSEIKGGAFGLCGNLQAISLPTTLRIMGDVVFEGCGSLDDVVIPPGIESIPWGLFMDCRGLSKFEIPNTVTTIGCYAFENCDNLKTVIIPNSVKSIGGMSFRGGLETVYSYIEDPFEIEDGTFYGWGDHTDATLYVPAGTIDKYRNTPHWDQFLNIREMDEEEESTLEYTDPTSNVVYVYTSMGTTAKVKAGDMTNSTSGSPDAKGDVVILDKFIVNGRQYTVTEMGDFALYGNDITSITIPATIEKIGLYGCYGWNLTNVIALGLQPASLDRWSFSWESYLNATLSLPEGAEDSYFNADGWKDFFSFVKKDGIIYHVFSWDEHKAEVAGLDGANDGILNISPTVEKRGETHQVTTVWRNTFHGNSSITSIIIPSTMTDDFTYEGDFYDNPFSSCSNLTTITVATNNPKFDSRSNCNAIIESATNTLVVGCKTSVIPDNVVAIARDAFYGVTFTEITIPASVQSIDDIAFGNCNSLKAFKVLSQKPFAIAPGLFDESFHNVFQYATLYVPKGSKAAYESAEVWKNFTNIVEMDNDSKLRTIHVATAGTLSDLISEADKYNIEELTLTGKLNGTDFRLLRDMAGNNYLGQITEGNLKVLDLSGAQIVEGGENYLDAECIYFNDYMWKNGPIQYGIIDNDEFPKFVFCGCKLHSITLPDGIIRIGSSAFYECRNLKTAFIPESITVIETDAFFGDENLQRIDLPNGLKTIESYAFCGCRSFEEMVIPETTETIGSFAFIGCSNITSLNIPASVKSIGIGITGTGSDKLISLTVSPDNTVYDSREGCNAIIEIRTNKLIAGCETTVIPQSVTCIGNRAFIHRMGYKSIVIPQNVTSIEEYAYGGCENVETLVLHAGIEKIEEGAFNGNKCLKTIHAYWPTPLAIKVNTFNSVNKDEVTLYVPYGSKSLYEQTDVWKDFKNIVEMEMDPDAPIDFADAEVKRICVENWDSNEDGELSYGEAAAVTDLGQVFK